MWYNINNDDDDTRAELMSLTVCWMRPDEYNADRSHVRWGYITATCRLVYIATWKPTRSYYHKYLYLSTNLFSHVYIHKLGIKTALFTQQFIKKRYICQRGGVVFKVHGTCPVVIQSPLLVVDCATHQLSFVMSNYKWNLQIISWNVSQSTDDVSVVVSCFCIMWVKMDRFKHSTKISVSQVL